MKRHIVTLALVIGLDVACYGQATIIVGNYQNPSNSPFAISSGLVFTNDFGHIGEIMSNVGLTVWAGPDTSSLSQIVTFMGNANGGTWFDVGQFFDPSLIIRTITTIPSQGTGAFRIQMWWDPAGFYNSYAAAVAASDLTGEVTFLNPTGGGNIPPRTFTGMPALILGIPEPATSALTGLGAAALWIFRRRRK